MLAEEEEYEPPDDPDARESALSPIPPNCRLIKTLTCSQTARSLSLAWRRSRHFPVHKLSRAFSLSKACSAS